MNMRSALLHVGADLVRSMVTVAEGSEPCFSWVHARNDAAKRSVKHSCRGCLVIFFHADGRSTDAYASLIVSLTVLVGAAAGMVSWTRPMLH